MRELFADVPEACDNTLEIAKRIDIRIPEKIFYLPDYPVPQAGRRAHDAGPARARRNRRDEYLRRDLRSAGLIERYGAERATNDAGAARAARVRTRRHHRRWASRRTS